MFRVIFVFFIFALFGCDTYSPPNESYGPALPTEAIDSSDIFRSEPIDGTEIRREAPPLDYERYGGFFGGLLSTAEKTKVALLVPLSGRYKKLGQQVLDGAQMAIFDLEEPNIQLVPIDTKGTRSGALEAAQHAVDQKVKLILGPVFGHSARAVAAAVKSHGIQVITYSNDSSLAGSGAFAMGFFPQDQVSRVTEYAIKHGVHDFVSLLPNNSYGGMAAKAIRETTDYYDRGRILKSALYKVNKRNQPVNLSRYVKSAHHAALHYNSGETGEGESFARYPRGMVMTDGGKRFESILVSLNQYGIEREKVQLLGGDSWYDDRFLFESLLDGAWFAALPKERRDVFESEFRFNYDYDAGDLSILAYDSAALAIMLARSSSGRDFSKQRLTDPRGFTGMQGIFRFKPDGLIQRSFAIMTIENGAFRELEPAPESFTTLVRRN